MSANPQAFSGTKYLWSYGHIHTAKASIMFGLFYAANEQEAQEVVDRHLKTLSRGDIKQQKLCQETRGMTVNGILFPPELPYNSEGEKCQYNENRSALCEEERI